MSIKLDPVVLKKLSSMTLRARYVVEGIVAGIHQSPLRGASLEFAQHRQYVSGDELKYLDWKIYGRTDRFYIKQYEEETNLKAYSIIDTSHSMGYASGAVSKLQYATYLSAALTYLMIKQRDSAGLITFSNEILDFIPPRNFNAHMHYIMNALDSLTSSGRTNFQSCMQDIGKRIKKRSLLILFSDMLDEPEEIIKSLKFFPYLKNDLIVFHILDPGEIYLKEEGQVEYIDMESRMKLSTRPEVIRKEYNKNIKNYLSTIERSLRLHKIDYYFITTDTPLDKAISLFMEGRKKILR